MITKVTRNALRHLFNALCSNDCDLITSYTYKSILLFMFPDLPVLIIEDLVIDAINENGKVDFTSFISQITSQISTSFTETMSLNKMSDFVDNGIQVEYRLVSLCVF